MTLVSSADSIGSLSDLENKRSRRKSKPLSSVRNFLATASVYTHCLKNERNKVFTVFWMVIALSKFIRFGECEPLPSTWTPLARIKSRSLKSAASIVFIRTGRQMLTAYSLTDTLPSSYSTFVLSVTIRVAAGDDLDLVLM